MRKLWENFCLFYKENKAETAVFLAITFVSLILRLYKIDEYMTFLGDEGRDAIVVRRLLVNFDPILVGPGTSIGNMYLGPLYYYLMAPALLLFNFSPVGPAVMIALLGVATTILVWLIAREWFGKFAAITSSLLFATAPVVINYSKSSWNPNIMPFFSILTIYPLWRAIKYKKYKWILASTVSFAFVMQSHYLGLLLLGPIGAMIFYQLFRFYIHRTNAMAKKDRRAFFKNILFGILLFSALMSPLLIFDARHEWRNFSAMKVFFTERQTTVNAKPWKAIPNIWPVTSEVTERVVTGTEKVPSQAVAWAIIFSSLYILFKKPMWRGEVGILVVWIFFGLLGLSLYKQNIYDHYYGFLYPALFLLIGAILNYFNDKKFIDKTFSFAFLIYLLFLNVDNTPIKYPPNNQLARTQNVSLKMIEESKGGKFNIAVIAERNYEGAYQYFLEKENANFVIIDPQRADETIAPQLFVICELPEDKCDPTHNPKAEIANFGWSVISDKWIVEGVTLFKLTHVEENRQ